MRSSLVQFFLEFLLFSQYSWCCAFLLEQEEVVKEYPNLRVQQLSWYSSQCKLQSFILAKIQMTR